MGAFPDPAELEMLLYMSLDKQLVQLVSPKLDYSVMTSQLIVKMEARGWTKDLILAARAASPEDPDLAAVAESLGLVAIVPSALERMVSKRNGLHGVASWRAMLGQTEARTCRIEVPLHGGAVAMGTAFLIGADRALTSFHVVEGLTDGGGDPARVRLLFDYKYNEDGTTLNEGTPVGLASDWLLSWSPASEVDDSESDAPPEQDELDFAVLQLDSAVGESTYGSANDAPGQAQRGWVGLEIDAPQPQQGDVLIILQHPEGAPLQLAMDSVEQTNEDCTRVRYRTNTMPGSSGSPCFNLDWQAIALHQSGSPASRLDEHAPYNQGISIRAIASRLAADGLLDDPTPA
jgi:hypothetical protein